MSKSRKARKGSKKRSGGLKGKVNPLVLQAKSNGARFDHRELEVVEVPNPYGEVTVRGEIRRHQAVRRTPHFEALYRSKVIDRHVFACLEWYADRLGLAHSGLIKCGLDVSGCGGGSAANHISVTEAAMEARSDVDWARSFLPDNDIRKVFDGVMGEGETFERVGALVYPKISLDRAKRKASSAFKIAANYLLKGVGSVVLREDELAEKVS